MSIAGFLNPCDNETYQRLLTLQEQYQECKDSLYEIGPTNDQLYIKRPSLPKPKRRKHFPMDLDQLATCIKHIILKQGGICHTETLVEFVRQLWPNARHSDGTKLTMEDYKIEILFVLRERSDVFYEEENGWVVDAESECEIDNETVPLVEMIISIIEDEDCSSNLEIIQKRVQQEWKVPEYRGHTMTQEEIRKAVAIIVETNPKFTYDIKNPAKYCVPLSKKIRKRNAAAAQAAAQAALVKGIEESSASESETEPGEPGDGFICACGATTPGKTATAKWRIDSNGVFKCITCYGKSNKRCTSKPVRKKRKTNINGNDPDSGPWIQCDKCHTWVMAFSDNIKDLSVYDDSNPNHLDYFCPDCRAKGAEQPQRKSTRRRSSRKE